MSEQLYLQSLNDILRQGTEKRDRTGIGTISLFGIMNRYDIRSSFPLITTKKMFWKGVVIELLWMLRGDTNIKYLNDHNIHIWDANSKNSKNGDLGPIYGYQWRNFNGDESVDQLAKVIESIKTDPYSRRHIVTAWNPCQIEEMSLPPCHMIFQFYVNEGKLSCMMTQRSADMFLGVPFNIASYSLLTYIIAKMCGLKPGEFIHSIGDAHIYKNHKQQVYQQVFRKPYDFPKLEITKNITKIEDLKALKFEDFKLINYKYHPVIKAKMAV